MYELKWRLRSQDFSETDTELAELRLQFSIVRWNCHLVWYLWRKITLCFLSKMQQRQDYELFLIFLWQILNAILNLMQSRQLLPLIELNLRLFTFYKRSDTNLISSYNSTENCKYSGLTFSDNGPLQQTPPPPVSGLTLKSYHNNRLLYRDRSHQTQAAARLSLTLLHVGPTGLSWDCLGGPPCNPVPAQ